MTPNNPQEPLIFSCSEHPITREMIDDDALFVLRKLNKSGFSAYLVGGGVRDLYIGKKPKDFDISTNAKPGQVRRLFPNSRTIGRRFRLVQVFFKKGKIIEVSTLRSLSEHDLDGPEAVLAPNNTYGSLDEDAQRRDLTINALFFEIENQTIIDYVGGVADLDSAVIRIIGEPEKRIIRDPVRMLRVIRHSARNNFVIENKSWDALCRNSQKLKLCPPSRLRDELLKDIYSGVSGPWFKLAQETGIFIELFVTYKDIIVKELKTGTTCETQLEAIFTTIDRLNNEAVASGRHRQPAYFLFSFILIPWAIDTFDISSKNLKGAALIHFSKQLRAHLNETIGTQLNFTRSTRQEITTLLAHLPLILQHRSKDTWPKWLKKKSYFKKCQLLYYYIREATEHIPVPNSYIADGQSSETTTQIDKQVERERHTKHTKHKGRPAFSATKKGGIFGFKK